MSQRVVRRIAFPMIGLGMVLSALGVAAAWNVHNQQNVSSELIAKEVSGVIAIEELHLEMPEIRYQINLLLRTKNLSHLAEVTKAHHTDRHHQGDRHWPGAHDLPANRGFTPGNDHSVELTGGRS